MKKLLLVIVMVFAVSTLFAQWGVNGNHIYNTNTANVGISNGALWTPSYKLHINTLAAGVASAMLESDMATGATAQFRLKNTTGQQQVNISLRKTGADFEMLQSAYVPGFGWGEYLYFNFTTRKYEMRGGIADAEFKNSGNVYFNNTGGGVGVGVTSLGAGVKFQVDGKIKCKEVEVALTPWPDHVFNANYNLRPLEEVEAFIVNNKHLPDVPNQQEIQNNGLNLGQMDAILLQKIEELTLYVIELKKENNMLKQKIEGK
jgi:hypothetical protein